MVPRDTGMTPLYFSDNSSSPVTSTHTSTGSWKPVLHATITASPIAYMTYVQPQWHRDLERLVLDWLWVVGRPMLWKDLSRLVFSLPMTPNETEELLITVTYGLVVKGRIRTTTHVSEAGVRMTQVTLV